MKNKIHEGRHKHITLFGQSRRVQLQAFIERIESGRTMEEAINTPRMRSKPYKAFLPKDKKHANRKMIDISLEV